MLFERYFGSTINLRKSYTNRLRNDQSAGCKFGWKNGILKFYDYSQSKIYDVIEWVKEEYGLTFPEALKKINDDFKIGTSNQIPKINVPYEIEESPEMKIQIVPQPYTPKFIDYYKKHLILPETCAAENVYCVKDLFYNEQKYYISDQELVIGYYFPEIDKIKILRPNQPKISKWRTNVPNTYIDGLSELDPSISYVIIVKSKKDKMLIKQLGFKNIVSVQMEGIFVINEESQKILEPYHKIIWMDGDATGQKVSKHYEEQGFDPVSFPDYYYDVFQITDPTDYTRVFEETSVIIKLLNDKINGRRIGKF
jgi:hypothetical protein